MLSHSHTFIHTVIPFSHGFTLTSPKDSLGPESGQVPCFSQWCFKETRFAREALKGLAHPNLSRCRGPRPQENAKLVWWAEARHLSVISPHVMHAQSPGKLHPAKPILITYLQVHEQKKCLLLSAAGFRAVCPWDYYD